MKPQSSTSTRSNTTSGRRQASSTTATASKKSFAQLVRTPQFVWFLGHLLVCIMVPIYAISYNEIVYRLTYIGILQSFGVIIYQKYYLSPKHHRSHAHQHRSSSSSSTNSSSKLNPYTLMNDENVLYLILAICFLITPRLFLSLVPYFLFSVFHVSRYLESTILPNLFSMNKENSPVVRKIDAFTVKYNERCMYWVGTIEIFTLTLLFFKALLFYRGSWIMLFTYTIFLKIRYENSKYTKAAFAQWRVRLDGVISHPSVPPMVKNAYSVVKSRLMELSKYQLSKPRARAQAQTETQTQARSTATGSGFETTERKTL